MSTDIPPAADPGALRQSVEQALDWAAPGSDPATIRHLANQLTKSATVLRAALERVQALGKEQTFWVGGAASAFAAQASKAPKHITAVADRYGAYAEVLKAYATSVETVHAALRTKRKNLRSAWHAYSRAELAVAAAATAAAAPSPHPFSVGTPAAQLLPTPAAVHLRTVQASASSHRGEVLVAHAALRTCYTDWEESARVAGRKLHHADGHNALQNPQGMHAFVNDVAHVMGKISTDLSIVGIVLLVLCPELAPIAFAVAAVASATKAAADLDRKFQYGEKVDGWDLTNDALGMVPVSGVGKTAVEAGRAARAGEGAAAVASRAGRHLRAEATNPFTQGWSAAREAPGVAVRLGHGIGRMGTAPAHTGSAAVKGLGRNALENAFDITENGLSVYAGLNNLGTHQAADYVQNQVRSDGAHGGPVLFSPDRFHGEPAPVKVTLPTTDGGKRVLRIELKAPTLR